MRVLVVGGAGYYSGLISEYLAAEHELSVLDVQEATQSFWSGQHVGSILDFQLVAEACRGHEAIVSFHKGDAEVSSVGTATLLGAAAREGVPQVIYTGSAGMAYPIPAFEGDRRLAESERIEAHWRRVIPVRETHGIYPGNERVGYFTNKWMGEQLGRIFEERGVYMTSIRPGNLMHEDMSCRDFETEKVVDCVHLLMCGHVTVRDAAGLYLAALSRPAGAFRVLNLANDTIFAQVSTAGARAELGFACADSGVYLDFYAKQDWQAFYRDLEGRRFPAALLDELRSERAAAGAST